MTKRSLNIVSRKKETRSQWTKEECQLLQNAVLQSGYNWFEIAKHLPKRNPNQCAQKWKRLKGIRSRKNQFWTKEEDNKLVQSVMQFGRQWALVSKQIENRSNRQCRERYVNTLDPSLKLEDFQLDEDRIIYQKYVHLGPKWSIISKELPGRSQNQVKNRFYTHIRANYLHIGNPYYTKLSVEQAKSILDNVRENHLIEFSNLGQYQIKCKEQATCEQSLSEQDYSNQNIMFKNQQHISLFDKEF